MTVEAQTTLRFQSLLKKVLSTHPHVFKEKLSTAHAARNEVLQQSKGVSALTRKDISTATLSNCHNKHCAHTYTLVS